MIKNIKQRLQSLVWALEYYIFAVTGKAIMNGEVRDIGMSAREVYRKTSTMCWQWGLRKRLER